MKQQRVYIVFCETVSPLGINGQALQQSLVENYNAVAPIKQFNADGLAQPKACEAHQDLSQFLPQDNQLWQQVAIHDRKFALMATVVNQYHQTLSNLLSAVDQKRTGISLGLGTNVFPMESIAMEVDELSTNGLYRTLLRVNQPVHSTINTIFNHSDLYANYIQYRLGKVGFAKNILTACSSSTQAIALAAAKIMSGSTDVMIAGGADSILNNFAYISFGKLGVLTRDECRPFDINRSGAIAGECAGIAVLASEAGVKAMGVDPAFELIGFGNSMDAHKITAPDPSGMGVETAMRKAISMSGQSASEINYINAHGTGTRSNDEVELRAIERIVGDAASHVAVSSTKDRHGHSIAAAGIQEFHVLLASMAKGMIPANLNTQKPLQTNLHLPLKDNVHQKIHIGMTNNFAFGGVNCSLLIKNLKP